ncbi:uncharacterized protein PG998_004664 [Apiospora kogelbergensis]|uniref:uncharacterized protein n=1 Tax=Apiospora kogelbergensis TaxID=1337665 RepID=UPI003130D884
MLRWKLWPLPAPSQSAVPSDATGTSVNGKVLRSYVSKSYLWQWNLELLMCFIIFSVPFVALGTMLPYQKKPLPQWPLSVSINSLISIYSTFLKAAIGVVLSSGLAQLQWTWFRSRRPLRDVVRYDEATRGPWGALQIVWAHRLRQPLTAFGAVIMILTVAMDPFVQQILRTVDCSVPSDHERATLPRTNLLGDFVIDNNNKDGLYGTYSSKQVDLRSAISGGVLSGGLAQANQCSTGNCTFPSKFTTLGICHQCQDQTEQLTVDSKCIPAIPVLKPSWDHCSENSSAVINSTFGSRLRTTFLWPTWKNNSINKPPMDLFAIASVYDEIGEFLTGSIGSDSMNLDPYFSTTSPEMLHIYNYGHVDFERIDEIMANVSESLTSFIRTHGNPEYSKPALGLVWRHTVCARVDWWWSAYPLTLAIGTLVFFTLVLSLQHRDIPVWKSSPLAWILRSADTRGQGCSAGHVSDLPQAGKRELEEASRDVEVSLKAGSMQYYQLEDLSNDKTGWGAYKKGTSSMPSLGTP